METSLQGLAIGLVAIAWLLWRKERRVEAQAQLFAAQQDLPRWPAHYRQLLGSRALVMVNEPVHGPLRAFHAKAFAARQLDSYLQSLHQITGKYLASWAESPQPNVHRDLKTYVLDCSLTVLVGDHPQSWIQLSEVILDGLGYMLPFDLPLLPFRRCLQARSDLAQSLREHIRQRRRKLKDPCRMFRICTMLDALLQAEAGEDDEELVDFCVGVIFGYEALLSSLESCLYWLKRLPGVEARLRRETAAWDGRVSRRCLETSHQLSAFIQEVWRTSPPVSRLCRELGEDAMGFPKGKAIYFTPQADLDFSMTRHLCDGKFCETASLVDAFGAGKRRCIGANLARDHLQIFLLHFLHGFELQIHHAREVKFPYHSWRLRASFSRAAHARSP